MKDYRPPSIKYISYTYSLILIICILIIFLLLIYVFFVKENDLLVRAQNDSDIINSQLDWQLGIYDTNKLNITENIKIKSGGEITLSDKVITANPDTDKDKVVDNNINTGWIVTSYTDLWRVDLGSPMEISQMKWFLNAITAPIVVYSSLDNITFIERASVNQDNVWYTKVFDTPFTARYLKLIQDCGEPAPCGGEIDEFKIFNYIYSATHTSAFAQIGDVSSDPGRYVVQYQTFTPTETEPANSDIRYRFRRTNADGSWTGDWTSYVNYTGTVIDLTQFSELNITQDDVTNERTYLQVETKFTRTDTSADPIVSDYTVTYHSNKAPNKPVAQ